MEDPQYLATNGTLRFTRTHGEVGSLLLALGLQGPSHQPAIADCNSPPHRNTTATQGVTNTVCGEVNAVVGG